MKAVGLIKEPQITKQPENQSFEVGDWVVAYGQGLGVNLFKRMGIVTDCNLQVCWLDNGTLSGESANSYEMSHIHHATAEELAAFNLKGE